MSNPLRQDGVPRTILILLLLWLLLAAAVAAGTVIGAWVIMQWFAAAVEGWSG